MTSELQQLLTQARSYLKNYVIAAHSGVSDGKRLDDILYDSLPLDVRKGSTTLIGDKSLVILNFCLDLLYGIHAAAQNASDQDVGNIGSMDLKAIDSLVGLVMAINCRPILTDGLGTHLPQDQALRGISFAPLEDNIAFSGVLQRIIQLLDPSSPVEKALKRGHHVALLLAAVIELNHATGSGSENKVQLEVVVKRITPVKLLQSLQVLLHPKCPPWAQVLIKRQMTAVLIKPHGLSYVSQFILQPDADGQIPLERINHLAALAASVPADMSIEDYLLVLLPQIYEAFDEEGSKTEITRRAYCSILRRLTDLHPQVKISLNDLWNMITADGIMRHDAVVLRTLQRISRMTFYDTLRPLVLSAHLSKIVSMSYAAHTYRQVEFRDLLERLYYRYVDHAIVNPMYEVLEILVDTVSELKQATHKTSPYDYCCRLLEQVKSKDALVVDFLHHLLLLDRQDIASTMCTVQIQLLMELPRKYANLVFSQDNVPRWVDAINKSLAAQGTSDEVIVPLSVLHSLFDSKPDLGQVERNEVSKLVDTLAQVSDLASNEGVKQTTELLLHRAELILLQVNAANQVTAIVKSSESRVTKESQDEVSIARRKYQAALSDMADDVVPNRAHGVYLIGELAKGSDAERSMLDLTTLAPVLLNLLGDEEPFVWHNASKAMKKLILVFQEDYRSLLRIAIADRLVRDFVKDRIREVLEAN